VFAYSDVIQLSKKIHQIRNFTWCLEEHKEA